MFFGKTIKKWSIFHEKCSIFYPFSSKIFNFFTKKCHFHQKCILETFLGLSPKQKWPNPHTEIGILDVPIYLCSYLGSLYFPKICWWGVKGQLRKFCRPQVDDQKNSHQVFKGEEGGKGANFKILRERDLLMDSPDQLWLFSLLDHCSQTLRLCLKTTGWFFAWRIIFKICKNR